MLLRRQVNRVITTIATAVVKRSPATGEISGNISPAPHCIKEVNENVAESTMVLAEISKDISEINIEDNQAGANSCQVQSSAQDVSALAARPQTLTSQFKV